MIKSLLPHENPMTPWYDVTVPDPLPTATLDQRLEFGALCGIAALNWAGPCTGRLDAAVKFAARAYCSVWLSIDLPEGE